MTKISPQLRAFLKSLPPHEEILAEIKRRSILKTREEAKSLSSFIRLAWPTLEPEHAYVHGWHIDAIAMHLEAVSRGEITRLLITVPPGSMKSLMVSVFWPAWEWGPCERPDLRYISTSHSESFASRDSRRMRTLVGSEWYQEHWPHVQLVRAGETSFSTSRMGGRDSMPFTSLTGGRANRVILDDVHSVESAESELERERVVRTFRESVTTRLSDPRTSAIVVIMQRLHERDVAGEILRGDFGYVHLMLPMEFEPERKCSTRVGFTDPREHAGELLFPERFPREVVERDKAAMGSYAWAGQAQQRPAPRGGGMLKVGQLVLVKDVPSRATFIRAWDFAASEETGLGDPDWTAGALCCWADGLFYILDIKRVRTSPGGVEQFVRQVAQGDGRRVSVKIPQDPGSAGKALAQHYARHVLAGFACRFAPVTGSKVQRADPLAAAIEAGNVRMLEGAWNAAWLDEARSFPRGLHDDQVDAVADAFLELTQGASEALWVGEL